MDSGSSPSVPLMIGCAVSCMALLTLLAIYAAFWRYGCLNVLAERTKLAKKLPMVNLNNRCRYKTEPHGQLHWRDGNDFLCWSQNKLPYSSTLNKQTIKLSPFYTLVFLFSHLMLRVCEDIWWQIWRQWFVLRLIIFIPWSFKASVFSSLHQEK